jgi:hypothetical protein
MFTILGSSIGAFFAAKRSHFAVLVICVALIFRGATTDELLTALATVCGSKNQKTRLDGSKLNARGLREREAR